MRGWWTGSYLLVVLGELLLSLIELAFEVGLGLFRIFLR